MHNASSFSSEDATCSHADRRLAQIVDICIHKCNQNGWSNGYDVWSKLNHGSKDWMQSATMHQRCYSGHILIKCNAKRPFRSQLTRDPRYILATIDNRLFRVVPFIWAVLVSTRVYICHRIRTIGRLNEGKARGTTLLSRRHFCIYAFSFTPLFHPSYSFSSHHLRLCSIRIHTHPSTALLCDNNNSSHKFQCMFREQSSSSRII